MTCLSNPPAQSSIHTHRELLREIEGKDFENNKSMPPVSTANSTSTFDKTLWEFIQYSQIGGIE